MSTVSNGQNKPTFEKTSLSLTSSIWCNWILSTSPIYIYLFETITHDWAESRAWPYFFIGVSLDCL